MFAGMSENNAREKDFHRMNDAIMDIAKVYMRWHDEEQDFGVGETLRREEIHTVQAIGDNEGMNITELAGLFNVTKPTISARIRKLAFAGLVEKRSGIGNNKEVLLFLTAKGWVAHANHEEKHHKVFRVFEEHFGAEAASFLESFTDDLKRFSLFLSDVKKRRGGF